jgi:hypothetical protein
MMMIETRWVVQDVFSSGIPGPGFTVHQTKEEAMAEYNKRPTASGPRPYRECLTCGSVLGIGGAPLQGGCADCR